MAKMKTYAVEIEVRHTITVFVDARRVGGAAEAVQAEDFAGFRYADDFPAPRRFDPKTMTVTRVREVGA